MAIDLDICSAALVRVGASPIDSMLGAGVSETACRTLYPRVVSDRLSGYRWRFATKLVTLERLEDAPLAGYSSAYQLPAGVQTVWSLRHNDALVDFDRSEGFVHVDAEPADVLIAEVTFRPNEAAWPDYFISLLELDLAAALAVPIAEDAQKAQYYEQKAFRQYAQAKTLDAQTRTARKIDLGGLRRYHRGVA